MKILKETLIERLRSRLAPAHAVKMIYTLQRATRHSGIDYMAVKEASEMVERYKNDAKLAIRQLRRWETRKAPGSADKSALEGRILKNMARQNAAHYLDARREYHDLVALALLKYQTAPSNQN
jgi:hypothetical protein